MDLDIWSAWMKQRAQELSDEEGQQLYKMCDALVALSHLPLMDYCSKDQLKERERLLGIIEGSAYRRRMICSEISTVPEQYWRKREVTSSQEGSRA